ncbi:MAG TPA: hypothetical protein VN085_12565 [Vicinamibacterales bacterium]|nr:hypothetical protein [Vicinamibacterales bacterium]
MRTVTLPLPVMGFVVFTRAALGVGIGLLLAGRLPEQRRRKIGLALVGVGAATTYPALRWILRSVRSGRAPLGVGRDSRLIGATRYPRKGDEVQA